MSRNGILQILLDCALILTEDMTLAFSQVSQGNHLALLDSRVYLRGIQLYVYENRVDSYLNRWIPMKGISLLTEGTLSLSTVTVF